MNQRVIKFLAWDIDLKRMSTIVYLGDGIVCFPNDTLPIAFCATRTERFVFRQYTGLNDKDGQEIYEGDIMQSPEWGCVVIRWLPDLGCFGCWHPTTGIHDNLIGYSQAQVIGNIYQNPELLQQ